MCIIFILNFKEHFLKSYVSYYWFTKNKWPKYWLLLKVQWYISFQSSLQCSTIKFRIMSLVTCLILDNKLIGGIVPIWKWSWYVLQQYFYVDMYRHMILISGFSLRIKIWWFHTFSNYVKNNRNIWLAI